MKAAISIVRLASSEEGAEEEEHQAEEGVYSWQDVLDEVDQQMSPVDLLHQFSLLSGNLIIKIGLSYGKISIEVLIMLLRKIFKMVQHFSYPK